MAKRDVAVPSPTSCSSTENQTRGVRRPEHGGKPQTAIGWSSHRDGRSLILGWGSHLTRAEKDRIRSRIAFLVLTAAIVSVLGLLGYGVLYEHVYLPGLPVVQVGSDRIALSEYAPRLRFERNRLLLRAQTLRAQIGGPIASADEDSQKAIRDLLQKQYNSLLEQTGRLPEKLQEDLVKEILIRKESDERGLSATEGEIELRVKEIIGYPVPAATPLPSSTPIRTVTGTAQITRVADGEGVGVGVPSRTSGSGTGPPGPQTTPMTTSVPVQTAAVLAVTEVVGPSAVASVARSVPITPTSRPLPTETPLPFPTYLARYNEVVGTDVKLIRSVAEGQVLRDKLNEALAQAPKKQEQVRARHILVPDKTVADTVVQRLDAGEDFASLAAELSIDTGTKDKGGDLGFFPRGVMVPAFEEAAFSLPIGATSPPVNSQFGYHIIRIEERASQRDVPLHQLQIIQAGALNRWLEKETSAADIKLLLDDRRRDWAERRFTG